MKNYNGFKKLSRKKKIEYLWDYYRYHFLLCLAAIAVLTYLLNHIMGKKPLLNVIMLNPLTIEEDSINGFSEFEDRYGSGEEVSLSPVYLSQNSMSQQVLSTMVCGGGNDVLIGTGEEFFALADQGALMDLREILSEDVLEDYKEQQLFCDHYDDLGNYPCAIEITGSKWLSDYPYYLDECYIGILYRGEHPEMSAEFVRYLFLPEK